MSNKIQEDLVLDTDNEMEADQELHWEYLIELRNELASAIIKHQALLLEMSKLYEKELKDDKSLYAMIEGLVKSLQDVAYQIVENEKSHKMENGEFKKGIVDDIDSKMEYLAIANNYIMMNESITSLIATAHIDIFTKLSVDNTPIKDALADAEDGIDKIIKG